MGLPNIHDRMDRYYNLHFNFKMINSILVGQMALFGWVQGGLKFFMFGHFGSFFLFDTWSFLRISFCIFDVIFYTF